MAVRTNRTHGLTLHAQSKPDERTTPPEAWPQPFMQTPDKQMLSTAELVAHLWRRRWVLLLAPCAVTIGTYLLIRAFGGETFESTAVVYLRERPTDERSENEPRLAWIDAPSYKDILLNDELLKTVVDSTRQKHPDSLGTKPYEKIKDSFRIRTVTTRDTAVQTTFSPVIEMAVEGPTPVSVKFMADTWLAETLRMYGNIAAGDAAGTAKALGEETDLRARELEEARRNEAKLDYELDRVKILLFGHYSLFYHGDLRSPMAFPQLLTPDLERESAWGGGRPTLFEQRISAAARVAELEAALSRREKLAGDPTLRDEVRLEDPLALGITDELTREQARLARIETLITETDSNIKSLAAEAARLEGEVAAARGKRFAADNAIKSLTEMAGYAIADAVLVPDEDDPQRRGALRVLARPILPEERVGPKRSLYAIAAGLAFGIFLLFSFVAEAWVRKSLGEDRG